MEVIINGFKPKGTINVPSSKSVAHRVLIMAFLLKRKMVINNVNYSDDIIATISSLEAMGAIIKKGKDKIFIEGFNECPKSVELDVKQSASTLRFLLPIAAYFCDEVLFKGDPSLFKRPMGVYIETFKDEIEFEQKENCLKITGNLKSSVYKVKTNVSSQFITGLIFLMVVNKKINHIILEGGLVSKNYIEMTKNVMCDFGIDTFLEGNTIKLNQRHSEIRDYSVEGDYSQAAFYFVLGAIKGDISLKNLNSNSLQGDKVVLDILSKMGVVIDHKEEKYIVKEKQINSSIVVDLENCIDLAPILFVLAAYNNGVMKFINTKRLEIKESNRLMAMKEELLKVKVDFEVGENQVIIKGDANRFGNYIFESHNDHRIAMAMSVFAVLNNGVSIIKGIECINKSYPNFINDLFSLKI